MNAGRDRESDCTSEVTMAGKCPLLTLCAPPPIINTLFFLTSSARYEWLVVVAQGYFAARGVSALPPETTSFFFVSHDSREDGQSDSKRR